MQKCTLTGRSTRASTSAGTILSYPADIMSCGANWSIASESADLLSLPRIGIDFKAASPASVGRRPMSSRHAGTQAKSVAQFPCRACRTRHASSCRPMRSTRSLQSGECMDRSDHRAHDLLTHFGIEREGNRFGAMFCRVGKAAFAISEVRQGRLQMMRNEVVHVALDTRPVQMLDQPVAIPVEAQLEDMPVRHNTGGDFLRPEAIGRKGFEIARDQPGAGRIHRVEMRELDPQDCS